MGKTVVAIIAAFTLGVAGGTLFARARLAPQLSTTRDDLDACRQDCSRLTQGEAENAQRLADAKERAATLAQEIADVETELAALSKPVPKPEPIAITLEAPDLVPPEPEPEPEAGEESRNRRHSREALTDEEMAARTEERRAMAARFREGVRDFMDTQIEQTADTNAKERLAALSEYSDYMTDLSQEFRNAETDEDRQAIRQDLDDARHTVDAMLQEQRAYMWQELAADSGIKGKENQEAFVESARELLTSPFFRDHSSLFGRTGFGSGGRPIPSNRRGPTR